MTDKNPYDTSIDWLAPQYPANRQEPIYTPYQRQPDGQEPIYTQQQSAAYYQAQQPPAQPAIKKAASAKQARMPKQRALELVRALKKGAVVSSIVSFGLLGLLATGHIVGTTVTTTKTTTPVTNSSSSSSTTSSDTNGSDDSGSSTTPSNVSSSSSSNNSSSSSNSSSSTNQGGFSFGSGSSQGSVSGTSVS